MDYVIPHPELSGLYHVSSDPISKYDLLLLAREAYQKDITILLDQEFLCDRSLDSALFRDATGYRPPAWPEMIREMASHASFYEKFRS
jgi:dTDP-4-dehydrorhamnose reductase